MRNSLFHLIIFGMIIWFIPQLCFAKTGYVSDMLLLTFRQGPNTSYAVTKTLKSNTPVSVIEEKNGFYKVELQSKEIGWVDMKFIVFEPPKTFIIDQLNQEKRALENKISRLESSSSTLEGKTSSQEISSLEASLKTALDENLKLKDSLSDSQKKYNTLIQQSKGIQKIIKDNKTLQEKTTTLTRDLDTLEKNNKSHFKTDMIKWFLTGVGTLLLGWIIGHNLSAKKRGSGSLLS